MAMNPVKRFGSATEFAVFGKSSLAYMRQLRTQELNEHFPGTSDLPDESLVWGLFGADGRPIAIAHEEELLMDDARKRELMTVSVQ